MFWLQRPPYALRTAAILVVAVALYAELRPAATVDHPFASTDIGAGAVIESGDIEWRTISATLPPVDDPTGAVAAHDIAAGEPLLPSSTTAVRTIPDGWWAVSVPLPEGVPTGVAVLLVGIEPSFSAEGIVVRSAHSDTFSGRSEGLVAVAAEHAATVAGAVARGDIITLVSPHHG